MVIVSAEAVEIMLADKRAVAAISFFNISHSSQNAGPPAVRPFLL
jgi:hypothetical protein